MIPECPCIHCAQFGSCQNDCEKYTAWLQIPEAE